MSVPRFLTVAVLVIVSLPNLCCVRRTARFTTEPAGARVFLNDRDIGETPANVEFTWYGDYDVIYRKEGYNTIKTHVAIKPPVYELFPIDFVAEVLWPGEIHDHHDIPTQELTPHQLPDRDELVQRAMELRDQALIEGPDSAQKTGR